MTTITTGMLLLAGFVSALHASTLPPPSTLAECVDSTVIDDPAACTNSGRDASASGSVTLFPFISLTAQSASGPVNALFNPGAGAVVFANYSFQVTGGNPGDVVPILVATNLTSNASSFSHAFGFAQIGIHTGFGATFVAVCTNGTCGTTNLSFSGTTAMNAFSGETDTIGLEAEANSGDSPLAEWANASADPFIFIDPSFAGAANYSIEVSPGVGNAIAPVPEPGTAGSLAGAAIVAMLLRRRGTRLSFGGPHE